MSWAAEQILCTGDFCLLSRPALRSISECFTDGGQSCATKDHLRSWRSLPCSQRSAAGAGLRHGTNLAWHPVESWSWHLSFRYGRDLFLTCSCPGKFSLSAMIVQLRQVGFALGNHYLKPHDDSSEASNPLLHRKCSLAPQARSTSTPQDQPDRSLRILEDLEARLRKLQNSRSHSVFSTAEQAGETQLLEIQRELIRVRLQLTGNLLAYFRPLGSHAHGEEIVKTHVRTELADCCMYQDGTL